MMFREKSKKIGSQTNSITVEPVQDSGQVALMNEEEPETGNYSYDPGRAMTVSDTLMLQRAMYLA